MDDIDARIAALKQEYIDEGKERAIEYLGSAMSKRLSTLTIKTEVLLLEENLLPERRDELGLTDEVGETFIRHGFFGTIRAALGNVP